VGIETFLKFGKEVLIWPWVILAAFVCVTAGIAVFVGLWLTAFCQEMAYQIHMKMKVRTSTTLI
jgi:hypothetical protein